MSELPEVSAYVLRFERKPDYLLAEVDGDRSSAQITLSYWNKIGRECERIQARRLLVIDHFRGNLVSVDDMRECVQVLRGTYLVGVRIAMYEPETENLTVLQHAEIEALDAGFAFRVFGSEREAEIWLLYAGG